jgi:hypothetical protein
MFAAVRKGYNDLFDRLGLLETLGLSVISVFDRVSPERGAAARQAIFELMNVVFRLAIINIVSLLDEAFCIYISIRFPNIVLRSFKERVDFLAESGLLVDPASVHRVRRERNTYSHTFGIGGVPSGESFHVVFRELQNLGVLDSKDESRVAESGEAFLKSLADQIVNNVDMTLTSSEWLTIVYGLTIVAFGNSNGPESERATKLADTIIQHLRHSGHRQDVDALLQRLFLREEDTTEEKHSEGRATEE